MTKINVIYAMGFASGALVMIGGVVLANLATQRMRRVLNRSRGAEEQLGWSDAVQKVAQAVIDQYRATHPDGPLDNQLKLGNQLSAIGAILGIVSAVALALN